MFTPSANGPRSVTCHICGRPSLIAGYEHHVLQCKRKFLKEQEALPLHRRKPLPRDPHPTVSGKGSGASSAARAEDSRPLTASNLSRADIAALNSEAAAQYEAENTESCEHCGRSFASGRLTIHQRSCTRDKPARRLAKGGGATAAGGMASPAKAEPVGEEGGRPRPGTAPAGGGAGGPSGSLAGGGRLRGLAAGLATFKGVRRKFLGQRSLGSVGPDPEAATGAADHDGGGGELLEDEAAEPSAPEEEEKQPDWQGTVAEAGAGESASDADDDGGGGGGESGRVARLRQRAARIEASVGEIGRAVAEVNSSTAAVAATPPRVRRSAEAAGAVGGGGSGGCGEAPSEPPPRDPPASATTPARDLKELRSKLSSRDGSRGRSRLGAAGPGGPEGAEGVEGGGSGEGAAGVLSRLEARTGSVEAALVSLLVEVRGLRAAIQAEVATAQAAEAPPAAEAAGTALSAAGAANNGRGAGGAAAAGSGVGGKAGGETAPPARASAPRRVPGRRPKGPAVGLAPVGGHPSHAGSLDEEWDFGSPPKPTKAPPVELVD